MAGHLNKKSFKNFGAKNKELDRNILVSYEMIKYRIEVTKLRRKAYGIYRVVQAD